MITDKLRFSVIQVNTDHIWTQDLEVKEPTVTLNLSGPARTSFKIDQGQATSSSFGIPWKPWGQWIVPEVVTDQYGRFCLGAQLVSATQIDPKTGDLNIDADGFLAYSKGIPWLENFNPIAVDPAEVIQRIYAHLQSYVNANLGIDVQPSSTGTQMLPGYGYDGSTLSYDFYAMFIRAVDFNDCNDQVMTLARDLPLDLFEDCEWNPQRTAITKKLQIAYPYGGVRQDALSFRLGENMISGEKAEPIDVEPVTDVIIRSWIPGKVYSSMLSNADMTQARRVTMEEAVNISSTEQAAAWAKRKLTKRNIPLSFQKITIDPNHYQAPFGSFWLGDSIYIEAYNYPWVGDIVGWHRITSITINDKDATIDLGVKAEGAWDYDPIIYDPDQNQTPQPVNTLLPNSFFDLSLVGWNARRGEWIHVITDGYTGDGCVRIDCDDAGEELESSRISINPGETLDIAAVVKGENVTYTGLPDYSFGLVVNTYLSGGKVSSSYLSGFRHDGVFPWTKITGSFVVPATGVNEISVSLRVNGAVTAGTAFWDDCTVLRPVA